MQLVGFRGNTSTLIARVALLNALLSYLSTCTLQNLSLALYAIAVIVLVALGAIFWREPQENTSARELGRTHGPEDYGEPNGSPDHG
jgi:hypothetical protein